MKRLLFLTAVTLCYATTIWAQEPAPRKDTIATFKVENSDDVVLSSGGGKVSIDIAGYSIALSQPKEKNYDARELNFTQSGFELNKVEYKDPENPSEGYKSREKSKITFASNSKLGLIMLTSPDYSAYSSDEQGFMDLRLGKSIYYGLDLVGLRVPLDNNGILTLKTGINLMCYNFTFDDDITIDYQNGMITPIAIESSNKKSKLTTAYATIPLSLSIDLGKKFFIEPGIYAGLIVNSHTKYKFPKVKSDYLNGVNQAIAGVSFSATHYGVGLYCNYNLTSLFEQGRGPETTALTFGISFKL